MPNQPDNHIQAIHETFSSMKSLWMRLISMTWDANTGNQFFYQSKKLATLIDDLNQIENHPKLAELSKKAGQTFQLIKTTGNTAPHQGAMTLLFKEITERLPILLPAKESENSNTDNNSPGNQNKTLENIKSNEVLLVSSLADTLAKQLKKAGFASRTAESLEQAAFLLTSGMPRAIIIELNFDNKAESGIQIIELFNKIRETLPPVIFISGEDTLSNRINTIKAGSLAYLPDPVNISALINQLKKGLSNTPVIPDKRILMIDNNDKEQRIFTQAMEYGFDARVLHNPDKLLKSLKIYKPELIIMNMELVDIYGYLLYQALRQHPAAEKTPFILIAKSESIHAHLQSLDRKNLDLIIQPASPEYLIWSIQQRIYQICNISQQLQKIDKQDKLTGLMNRHYFLKKIKETLHSTSQPFKTSATVILVMIDNINEIRTQTDAARADEIIMRSALAFKQSIQSISDKILIQARFTDNIFSLLCTDTNKETIKSCAQRLIKKIELSGKSDDIKIMDIDVKVCVGISAYQSAPPKDYLALIDQAKMALIRAQKKEQDRIHILDPDAGLKKVSDVSDEIIEKINYAFENGLLKLYFQAIAGFEQEDHQRYEVCLRIFEEDGTEIDSHLIFEAIEEHPLNYILDCWVIEQSIKLFSEKNTSENNEKSLATTLFINISPRTLQEDDFFDCYKEILTSYNMSSFQFVFEFSQQTLINYHEAFYDMTKNFKDSGCYFSLQQYEGGEQTNELLKEFGFNYVKASNNWLEKTLNDQKSQQQFKNFISAMNAQNITIIASEIESIQLLPLICTSGIKYVQGYFLHQPDTSMNYDFSHGIF